MSHGQYIAFLMDDDLFAPDKIECMMAYFISDKEQKISLVTSHRKIIDKNGEQGSIYGNTEKFFNQNMFIDGFVLGNFMLRYNFNVIGEPTTAIFRKDKLTEPFGMYCGRRFGCNVDQAAWFTLLSNGHAVFINKVLSYFRIHENQQLASEKMKVLGALDYAHAVLMARQNGFLQKDKEWQAALAHCLHDAEFVLNKFGEKENLESLLQQDLSELQFKAQKLKDMLNYVRNGAKSHRDRPHGSIV